MFRMRMQCVGQLYESCPGRNKVDSLLTGSSISQDITRALQIVRITALQNLDRGVRGVVAGDVIRRLVAHIMAPQIEKEIDPATRPFQYALSCRAGTE